MGPFFIKGDNMNSNHEEALEYAHLHREESNIARCYIDLAENQKISNNTQESNNTQDMFAAAAMQAFLIRDGGNGFAFNGKELARASYDAANFMLNHKITPTDNDINVITELLAKFCATHDLISIQRITIENFATWVRQQHS
jgi:uncharacterized membrane-anchored protein